MMKNIYIKLEKNRMLTFIIQTSLGTSNLYIKRLKVRYKYYKRDKNLKGGNLFGDDMTCK